MHKWNFFASVGYFFCALPVSARVTVHETILRDGFQAIEVASDQVVESSRISDLKEVDAIRDFCIKLSAKFSKYHWDEDPCHKIKWRADMVSSDGNPFIYAEFGSGTETTMILGGVHPDELTPVPLTFRFAKYLMENPDLYKKSKFKIIIAPLVNPDGFLRPVPSRTNPNGIDPNRNFFTMDWYGRSRKNRQGAKIGKQYFPGYFPNSELETLFQIELMGQFHPDKILSVHAPLCFLDYDGPGNHLKPLNEKETRAGQLVKSISVHSKDYRIVDYGFYPGSLGNFAGNERRIPTVTLELPTTDPRKLDEYWSRFLPGLVETVKYRFKTETLSITGNASPFHDVFRSSLRTSIGPWSRND